jgi:D-tagatose-1,6-bisphosphate aldolase subunit GatZ/KbaZ
MRPVTRAAAGPTDLLREVVVANRGGRPVGLTSVCSANRFVLETALLRAARGHGLVCIESTSSQVNQSGGYTGMTAAAFRDEVAALAAAAGVPPARVMLGGDHLGPYPWRGLPAREALAHAHELVRSCVLAGYAKIHLDASMRCADDPGDEWTALSDEVIVERTVALCRTAEDARAELPAAAAAPLYVIGSEVPTPGGEEAGQAGPLVTPVEDVERTLRWTRDGFLSAGLSDAWGRVIAVVVQPGVEFGDDTVSAYERAAAGGLAAFVERRPRLVYEAHSTDYQSAEALRQLVADHFAILKVGPWLTYAFREAVFALEEIESQVLRGRPGTRPSRLRDVLDEVMTRHPEHWAAYYRGSPEEVRRKRAFSYSDRCRYYWPQPAVQGALAGLLRNLSGRPIPMPLIDEFLPESSGAVRESRLPAEPVALIRHHIQHVLDLYAAACGQ